MSTTSIIDTEGPITEGPVNQFLATAKIDVPAGTISNIGAVFKDPKLKGDTVQYEISKDSSKKSFSNPMNENISSIEAPIGTWVASYGAYRPPNYPPTLPDIDGVFLGKYSWGNNLSKRHGQDVNYNIAEYHPDIAKDCGRTFFNQGNTTERDIGNGEKTTKCIMADVQVPWDNKIQFVEYGLHYPTFCQLGDFVLSNNDCRSQCKDEEQKLSGESSTYCDFAMNRMCSLKKGDPFDREIQTQTINNPFGDDIEVPFLGDKLSDKDYIKDEPECVSYCGTSFHPSEQTSKKCKEAKRSMCARKSNNWNITDPSGMLTYCMSFWSEGDQLDIPGIERVCGEKLSDPSSVENVFGSTGCANICGASGIPEVNKLYCDDKRLEYCSKNDPISGKPLIFTKKCFDLCKEKPDECKSLLESSCIDKFNEEFLPFEEGDLDENNDLTEDKYNEIENWLENEEDGVKIKNYCGCFYQLKYIKGIMIRWKNYIIVLGFLLKKMQNL